MTFLFDSYILLHTAFTKNHSFNFGHLFPIAPHQLRPCLHQKQKTLFNVPFHVHSKHSKSLKESISYSQGLRIKQICSAKKRFYLLFQQAQRAIYLTGMRCQITWQTFKQCKQKRQKRDSERKALKNHKNKYKNL